MDYNERLQTIDYISRSGWGDLGMYKQAMDSLFKDLAEEYGAGLAREVCSDLDQMGLEPATRTLERLENLHQDAGSGAAVR